MPSQLIAPKLPSAYLSSQDGASAQQQDKKKDRGIRCKVGLTLLMHDFAQQ